MNDSARRLMQPTLAGDLVHLSPMQAADRDALYEVAKDPLIWEQHPSWDRYKPEVFRALFDSSIASGGALTVREAATGEVIGSTRFYDHRPQDRSVAIGYTFLARRCWGGAYNHEMKRLLLEHSFRHCDRVWFHIGSQNIRSRTAIGRIGARFSHEVLADPAFGSKDMVYYFVDRPADDRPA